MTNKPVTCDVCGVLVTKARGGELVRMRPEDEPVWVHPGCEGAATAVVYVPLGDARFAFLSLYDPIDTDSHGWVDLRAVEAQRGRWSGSDAADFEAGLEELVNEGWVEVNEAGDAYRLTPKASVLRSCLDLIPPALL